MKFFKLFILVAVITLYLSGCSLGLTQNKINADKGVLDLTSWDFNKYKTVQLDGQWEFYWSRFLSNDELAKLNPDLYANVPNTWNNYSINGKSLPGQGCATYRLHVKTDLPEDSILGLRIYTFSSAYKLYINEKFIASNGKIAETAKAEVGEYRPQAVVFKLPAKEFDIMVQVSNFQYARGGFWYTMHLGKAEEIMNLQDSIMVKEFFLLGVLGIVSIFFLTVFILRRELKYCLYFACLCITMGLTVDLLGQLILTKGFPELDLKLIIFIWYSASIWIFYFLIVFVNELFKSRLSTISAKVYFWIVIISQAFFLFFPTTFYTKWFAQASDFLDIMGATSAVIIVVIGIRRGQKDGWLNIAGIMAALAAYIHDDLLWMNIITNSYGEIIYIGLIIFLFLQMVIQAKRIKLYYEYQTAAELALLQAQIKPHFLYNALNTFVSISRYDMDKARSLIIEFGNYLRKTFDFRGGSQLVPLKHEIELVKAYVEIEKARFEERLEVNFDLPENMEMRIPMLVLQPIVENAVIHGILPKPEGGRIDIGVSMQGNVLHIRVKDNGVGMKQEKWKRILTGEGNKRIGLVNIEQRLKKLYGKSLEFQSESGVGTEIGITIPLRSENR